MVDKKQHYNYILWNQFFTEKPHE